MATMIIKTEVEATPKLVVDALLAYVAQTKASQFPYPAGTPLILKPEYLEALQGVPGMPVVVMVAAKGTPLGLVAIHQITGDITIGFIAEAQVLDKWPLD